MHKQLGKQKRLEIAYALSCGWSVSELAKQYDVSTTTVYYVKEDFKYHIFKDVGICGMLPRTESYFTEEQILYPSSPYYGATNKELITPIQKGWGLYQTITEMEIEIITYGQLKEHLLAVMDYADERECKLNRVFTKEKFWNMVMGDCVKQQDDKKCSTHTARNVLAEFPDYLRCDYKLDQPTLNKPTQH